MGGEGDVGRFHFCPVGAALGPLTTLPDNTLRHSGEIWIRKPQKPASNLSLHVGPINRAPYLYCSFMPYVFPFLGYLVMFLSLWLKVKSTSNWSRLSCEMLTVRICSHYINEEVKRTCCMYPLETGSWVPHRQHISFSPLGAATGG